MVALKPVFHTVSVHTKYILPCQVLRKAECEERIATIETSKVNEEEENLVVAGERCWKNIFLQSLEITGELFTCFPWQVLLVAVKVKECTFLPQRLGSCLSSSFLLCWPMLCLPLSSSTMMADPISFISLIMDIPVGLEKSFKCLDG